MRILFFIILILLLPTAIFSKTEDFNKIVLSMESTTDSFIEKSDMSIFYYILTNISPTLAKGLKADSRLKEILSENLNSKNMVKSKEWDSSAFHIQAVLDTLYFGKRSGYKIPMELKKYSWERHNLEKSSVDKVLTYIYKRILDDLEFRDYNIKEIEKSISKEIFEDKLYYGYFFTHIIIYDSEFFSKNLNLKDYYEVLKQIAKLTDFVVSSKNYDLASELYMCLGYFQLFEWDEFKKLDKFLFDDDSVLSIVLKGGTHLKAVYATAYAMRYENSPVDKELVGIKDREIYYEVYGHGSKKTPIIIITGGPGWSHDVALPLIKLAKNRQILLYDQMGTGKSSRGINWNGVTTVEYVENLYGILNHLKWEKVILLGHSWGSMVALDYSLKYPARVEKLILSSPVISGRDWVQDTGLKFNKLKDKYKVDELDDEYNRRYISENIDMYRHLMTSFNKKSYEYLWGKSEYEITGWSRTYEREKELHKLKLPVLITAGENDEMSLSTIKKWNKQIDNCYYEIFSDTGHIHYLDKNREYIKVINNFIKKSSFRKY